MNVPCSEIFHCILFNFQSYTTSEPFSLRLSYTFLFLYIFSSPDTTMPTFFEDNRRVAYEAEKNLNSYQAKQGLGAKSDSGM